MHFPRSCLHCEEPACVTVCPTGASYKRAEDGIVLVNEELCIGCKLCSWACPYGAREFDDDAGRDEEMHAVHRPHLQREPAGGGSRAGLRHDLPGQRRGISAISAIPDPAVSQLVAERGGYDLMPELGYRPVNKYLPPRPARMAPAAGAPNRRRPSPRPAADRLLRWVDRLLSR